MNNFSTSRYLIILLAVLSASCGAALPTVKPYKLDVQQGNVVTSKMLLQLRAGMSKSQVRFIMGTPLVQDSFHTNRWDYVYQLREKGKVSTQRRVILDFEGDALKTVRGDVYESSNEDSLNIAQAADEKVINKKNGLDNQGLMDDKLKPVKKDEASLIKKSEALKNKKGQIDYAQYDDETDNDEGADNDKGFALIATEQAKDNLTKTRNASTEAASSKTPLPLEIALLGPEDEPKPVTKRALKVAPPARVIEKSARTEIKASSQPVLTSEEEPLLETKRSKKSDSKVYPQAPLAGMSFDKNLSLAKMPKTSEVLEYDENDGDNEDDEDGDQDSSQYDKDFLPLIEESKPQARYAPTRNKPGVFNLFKEMMGF